MQCVLTDAVPRGVLVCAHFKLAGEYLMGGDGKAREASNTLAPSGAHKKTKKRKPQQNPQTPNIMI